MAHKPKAKRPGRSNGKMARRHPNRAEAHWTIERKIPAALIIAILVQSASAIWWAAGVNGALNSQNDRQTRLEQTVRDQGAEIKRLPSLETEVRALQRAVEKLDRTIDRAVERLSPAGAKR